MSTSDLSTSETLTQDAEPQHVLTCAGYNPKRCQPVSQILIALCTCDASQTPMLEDYVRSNALYRLFRATDEQTQKYMPSSTVSVIPKHISSN